MKKKAKKQTVKSLQKTLFSMCPSANKVSIFHLSLAISHGYKFFLTSDQALLLKTKTFKTKYHIILSSDPYDAQAFLDKKKDGSPVEFYL